jgi:hypothetical protein
MGFNKLSDVTVCKRHAELLIKKKKKRVARPFAFQSSRRKVIAEKRRHHTGTKGNPLQFPGCL